MRIPLFWKIAISFILGIVVPALILFISFEKISADYFSQEIYLRHRLLARQVSNQINFFFSLCESILKHISKEKVFFEQKEEVLKKEEILTLLKKYQREFTIYEEKIFDGFLILDKQGRVYFTFPYKSELIGLDHSYFKYYQEIIEGKEKYISSEVTASLFSKEPVIEMAVPIKNEKEEVSFVIVADISLKSLTEIFQKITGKQEFFIVDEKGMVILHLQPNTALSSQREIENINALYPGLFKKFQEAPKERIIFWPENKPSLIFSWDFFLPQKWYIIFSQDIESAFLIYYNLKKVFSLLIGTFFIFVLLISFLISQRITSPIRKMEKLSEQVAKGRLDVNFGIKTGDEIEELSRHLDFMVKEIREYQEELEDSKKVLEIKVRARTRQLQEQALALKKENEEKTKKLREKLKELERFYKLSVGRELKMIELKKENAKLKEELKKYKELLKQHGSNK